MTTLVVTLIRCDGVKCEERHMGRPFATVRSGSVTRREAREIGWYVARDLAYCPECKKRNIRAERNV